MRQELNILNVTKLTTWSRISYTKRENGTHCCRCDRRERHFNGGLLFLCIHLSSTVWVSPAYPHLLISRIPYCQWPLISRDTEHNCSTKHHHYHVWKWRIHTRNYTHAYKQKTLHKQTQYVQQIAGRAPLDGAMSMYLSHHAVLNGAQHEFGKITFILGEEKKNKLPVVPPNICHLVFTCSIQGSI